MSGDPEAKALAEMVVASGAVNFERQEQDAVLIVSPYATIGEITAMIGQLAAIGVTVVIVQDEIALSKAKDAANRQALQKMQAVSADLVSEAARPAKSTREKYSGATLRDIRATKGVG